MSNQLLEIIQQVAVEAVKSNNPVNVLFGVVTSEQPLEITVDQKRILSQEFLILTRSVTDYEVNMTVDHVTEKMSGGGGDPSFASHMHQYKGTKPFKVLNALKQGEKVLLLVMQGGQKYIVVDRVI